MGRIYMKLVKELTKREMGNRADRDRAISRSSQSIYFYVILIFELCDYIVYSKQVKSSQRLRKSKKILSLRGWG